MGGEGSMMAANQSLKSNRSLLSKRKERGALSGSYAHVEMKDFPSASVENLISLKLRLQSENRKNRIRLFLIFGLILLVLTFIFFLFLA